MRLLVETIVRMRSEVLAKILCRRPGITTYPAGKRTSFRRFKWKNRGEKVDLFYSKRLKIRSTSEIQSSPRLKDAVLSCREVSAPGSSSRFKLCFPTRRFQLLVQAVLSCREVSAPGSKYNASTSANSQLVSASLPSLQNGLLFLPAQPRLHRTRMKLPILNASSQWLIDSA